MLIPNGESESMKQAYGEMVRERTFNRMGILFPFQLLSLGLLLPLVTSSSEICIADPTSDWEQPNSYRHYLH